MSKMVVTCYRSLHLKDAYDPENRIFTFSELAARNCLNCRCENICDRRGENLAPGCENFVKNESKEK